MVLIVLFVIIENGAVKYVWVINHLRQCQAPIFVSICLQ